ncbi:E3 ubiquitin-protein ligase RNF34 isoform X2 [Anabrus simplex]|uniref:E3 ubiquitin-protein ligase RNF34 isoform X2 n=1 Tax=Anabrus simplex TaxID=316456 RepID=UPI0035A2E83C
MSCEKCRVQFSFLRRKKQCSKCQRAFCNKCIVIQPGQYECQSLLRPGDKSYICASCLVFTSQPICRSQIARLRISDLKIYLKQQNVKMTACIEKNELVDLVMQHASLSAAVCNCRCSTQINPQSFFTAVGSVDPQLNINSDNSRETLDAEMSNALPDQQMEVNASTENDSESGVEIAELLSNASDRSNVNRTEPVCEEPIDLSTSLPAARCSGIDVEPKQFEERIVSDYVNTEDPHPSAFYFGAAGSSGKEQVFDASEHVSLGKNEHVTSADLNASEESVVYSYEECVPNESGSDAGYVPSGASGSAGYCVEAAGNVEYLSKNLAKFFGNTSHPERAGEGPCGGAGEVFTEGFKTCDNVSEQPGPSRVRDVIHIKDVVTLEKLETLTVKQMKQLLYDNRVDFSGCREKVELVDRLTRLWIDVHLCPTNPEYLNPDDLCKVCMDAKIDCVMLRCGHMATCLDCGRVQDKCPICRVYVISVLRVFRT